MKVENHPTANKDNNGRTACGPSLCFFFSLLFVCVVMIGGGAAVKCAQWALFRSLRRLVSTLILLLLVSLLLE